MVLTLKRTYYPMGTNGDLYVNGSRLCHTIELPDFDNWPFISCIPEGKYRLMKRNTERLKDHYMVMNVPGRSLILIHPANHAKKQLHGCIAPVMELTGEGQGIRSVDACKKLSAVIDDAMDKRMETVWLSIESAAAACAPVVAMKPGPRRSFAQALRDACKVAA